MIGINNIGIDGSIVINNICYDNGTNGSVVITNITNVYNNTLIGNGAGIGFKSGTASLEETLINNVACNFATCLDSSINGVNVTSNATSDLTGDITGIVLTNGVDFTEPSIDDYTLCLGSALIGQGADLSLDFTSDIIGATRTIPWDIGVFKYVSGGPVEIGELRLNGVLIPDMKLNGAIIAEAWVNSTKIFDSTP